MIPELRNTLRLHSEHLRRLVADLDDRALLAQPSGIRSHAAWTVGHLVTSLQLLGGELGISPWLPKEWAQTFGTGSRPDLDPARYPGRDRLLWIFDNARGRIDAALETLDPERLAEPLPDIDLRDELPTLGHALLHILAAHFALHLGQLTAWRQAAGHPPVREPLG